MICDNTFTNEIIIHGRVVGTPSVSSVQMVNQLQNFILNQPSSLVYQGQILMYVKRCSVTINSLEENTCVSAVDQDSSTTHGQPVDMATPVLIAQLPYPIIGGAAGGGLLLIIVMIVVIVITVMLFKKIRRGKEYSMGGKSIHEM